MSAMQQIVGSARLTAKLVFQSVSYANALNINLPSGVSVGDLLVFFDGPSNTSSTPPAAPSPSGWTLVGTNTAVDAYDASSQRSTIFYKVATAGDISTGSVAGSIGNSSARKTMSCFRPSSFINTLTALGFQGVGATGSLSPQTIVSGNSPATCLALVYGRANGVTHITGAGMTLLTDPSTVIQEGAYAIQNTSTNNFTVSAASSASYVRATLQSFYLLLT